ncbi:MAG: type III secretion system export apparatus subunit SctV [Thiotrichales bacterium]
MFLSLQAPLLALTRRSDIALAIMLVSIIFMMILPIPTWLVDTLVAVNIGTSVILLMVAVYIQSPVAFSAFPAVLLLTTLFRLALSITTTRLILLQADAGAIIYTFGDFVVGGNLIVGLVVFLIITLVQFIVVTKGSERVAEVSARFSLDGMPGKQMSIDSDLRAGLITIEQARTRRTNLERESQLYGSMDGAMKFVKGDAIAGILIILVNIIGGLSIGVFQQGMETSEALELYSILTIGDGLVTQIPALFIAITAGIIVTRVASEDGSNLGADIGNQVLAQPNALLIGAAIMVGFAMIPGFPAAVFLVLGAVTGAIGLTLTRMRDTPAHALVEDVSGFSASDGKPSAALSDGKADQIPNVPVLLDVSVSARAALAPTVLNPELAKVRKALHQRLGVPFPGVHMRFTPEVENDGYVITVHEIPVGKGSLGINRLLSTHGAEDLEILNIPAQDSQGFLPGPPAVWIDSKYRPQLNAHGIEVLSPSAILSRHLAHVLHRNASQFVGIQETHQMLQQIEQQYSELIKETLRALPLGKLADVLRRLVAEDVSIRDLRMILEALVEWAPKEQNTEQLCEYVRISLKRQISYRFSAGNNLLPVYLIDPAIEDTLRNSVRQTPTGSYLALDPEVSAQLMSSIRDNVRASLASYSRVVLLTTMELRRHLRKLIELEFHEVPVLSFQELAPEITVQPLGKIGLAPAGGGA